MKSKGAEELVTLNEKEIATLVEFLNSTIIAAELQSSDMDGLSIPLLIVRLTEMSGIKLKSDISTKLETGGVLTTDGIN